MAPHGENFEGTVKRKLKSLGWKVFRIHGLTSWPDFYATKGGKAMWVECKVRIRATTVEELMVSWKYKQTAQYEHQKNIHAADTPVMLAYRINNKAEMVKPWTIKID